MKQHLSDHHAISVGANFTDTAPPAALLDVRGKQVLKPRNGTAVLGQFDASAVDVAAHMDAESIPNDIKTFIDELVSLA